MCPPPSDFASRPGSVDIQPAQSDQEPAPAEPQELPPGYQQHYGIQRKPTGERADAAPDQITGAVAKAASSGGIPVEPVLRARVEGLTGADLSGVRIHTGEASQQAAALLKAHAFTVGHHVHFGAGEYRPGTPAGDALIAHELVHALQQGPGDAGGGGKLAVDGDSGAEHEADEVAAALSDPSRSAKGRSGPAMPVRGGSQPQRVQRKAYADLSSMQQAQVDGVHNSLYFTKLKTFEQQVGEKAYVNPAAKNIAKGMATRLRDLVSAWAGHHGKNVNQELKAFFQHQGPELPGSVDGRLSEINAIAAGGNLRECLALLCAPETGGRLQAVIDDVLQNVVAHNNIASPATQGSMLGHAPGHVGGNQVITPSQDVEDTHQSWVKQTRDQGGIYGGAVINGDPLNNTQPGAFGGAIRVEEYKTLDQGGFGVVPTPAQVPTNTRPNNVPHARHLSGREMNHAFHPGIRPNAFYNNRRLPYQENNPHAIRKDSAYAEEARRLKVLVRGMGSERTNYLMQLADYLGYNTVGDKQALRLANMGWLIPSKQHTMHEILLAAAPHVPYNAGDIGDAAAVAPLTKNSFVPQLLPDPDYQAKALKDPIADVLYPGKATRDPAKKVAGNERTAALANLPVDLHAPMNNLVANFKPVLDDDVMAPLELRGIPRTLVQTLDWAIIRDLTLLAAGDQLAPPITYAGAQGLPLFGRVSAAAGANVANMIFGTLFEHAQPGAQPGLDNVERVTKLYQPGYVNRPGVGNNLGYDAKNLNPLDPSYIIGEAQQRRKDYGENNLVTPSYDRGQLLPDPGNLGLQANEALAIADYSMSASPDPKMSTYTRFTSLARNPFKHLNAIGGAKQLEEVERLEALDSGLDQLPPAQGPVYFGYPGLTAKNLNTHLGRYSPGNIISFQRNVSSSRTVRDNHWIGPNNLCFIVENFTSGRDVQMLSRNSGEREVLFPIDTSFVVTRVEDTYGENQQLTIHLNEAKGAVPGGVLPVAGAKLAQLDHDHDGRRLVDAPIHEKAQQNINNLGHHPAQVETIVMGARVKVAQNVNDPGHAFGQQNFVNWQQSDVGLQGVGANPITQADIEGAHDTMAQGFLPQSGLLRGQGLQKGFKTNVNVGWGAGPRLMPQAEINHLSTIQYNGQQLMRFDYSQEWTGTDPRNFGERVLNNTRWVYVAYPTHNTVMALVNQWILDFNNGLGIAPDPVAFASRMQRILVSIHPFIDGNGRITRLIMDHALRQRGLRAPILSNPSIDQSSTENEWAEEVRDGVMRAYILESQYA
jgi:hypothetical protein